MGGIPTKRQVPERATTTNELSGTLYRRFYCTSRVLGPKHELQFKERLPFVRTGGPDRCSYQENSSINQYYSARSVYSYVLCREIIVLVKISRKDYSFIFKMTGQTGQL